MAFINKPPMGTQPEPAHRNFYGRVLGALQICVESSGAGLSAHSRWQKCG
jgi:hypothetical protein